MSKPKRRRRPPGQSTTASRARHRSASRVTASGTRPPGGDIRQHTYRPSTAARADQPVTTVLADLTHYYDYIGRTLDHARVPRDTENIPYRLIHRVGADGAQQLIRTVADWQAYATWSTTRIVHDFHPTLTRELAATDPAGALPPQVWSRLPYPNPLLVFGHAPSISLAEGGTGWLRAVLVVGLTDGRYCSTVDARRLRLVAHIDEPATDGAGLGSRILSNIVLPEQITSVQHTISAIAEDYDLPGKPAGSNSIRTHVHDLLQVTLPCLLYLCATGADRQRIGGKTAHRAARIAAAAGTADRRPTSHYERVGYHLGPALDTARAHYEQPSRTTGQPGARSVRPHVRRAHWHIYRTGPGRTQQDLHWLFPVRVNVDLGKPETTVVPVKDTTRPRPAR